MKKALKKKWVKALRSGKYKQGRGQLRIATESDKRKDDAFCCLGVLCQISKLRAVRIDGSKRFSYEQMSGMPSLAFREKCGLKGLEVGRLAGMNDNGKTFEEIADYIEKNL